MGRIVTQVTLSSFADPVETMTVSALVDTGAAYIALPSAWRETLGEV
jgi:predicted aspartyl protease